MPVASVVVERARPTFCEVDERQEPLLHSTSIQEVAVLVREVDGKENVHRLHVLKQVLFGALEWPVLVLALEALEEVAINARAFEVG